MSTRPRIAVFSTGGTIASTRGADGAASPHLSAEQLVAAVPQLAEVADIETVRFRQVASSDLTVADVVALAERLDGAVADGLTGAVVTQGTNTLEETSFVLDLLWDREEAVAFTGAMRHPDLPGADGPANLLAASVVASSPLARGLGCLVVFNDEVHLPLFVHKSHTSNPATFRSATAPPSLSASAMTSATVRSEDATWRKRTVSMSATSASRGTAASSSAQRSS